MSDVVLVDAGGTNIGSVRYALQRLGIDAALSRDADVIRAAERVILPGVGAAGPGMERLRQDDLIDVIRGLTRPVLGICLGMQLLFDHSDEGDVACLGVIPGRVRRLPSRPGLRIPHMGWNHLRVLQDDPVLRGLAPDATAYFVHSHAADVSVHTLASSEHGKAFSAVVRHRNFHGMQFHPERSGEVGADLLRNFLCL